MSLHMYVHTYVRTVRHKFYLPCPLSSSLNVCRRTIRPLHHILYPRTGHMTCHMMYLAMPHPRRESPRRTHCPASRCLAASPRPDTLDQRYVVYIYVYTVSLAHVVCAAILSTYVHTYIHCARTYIRMCMRVCVHKQLSRPGCA